MVSLADVMVDVRLLMMVDALATAVAIDTLASLRWSLMQARHRLLLDEWVQYDWVDVL